MAAAHWDTQREMGSTHYSRFSAVPLEHVLQSDFCLFARLDVLVDFTTLLQQTLVVNGSNSLALFRS